MWWSIATDLAARQHGLVAAWQLPASQEALRHAIERGRLERVRQGVFRVAGAPDSRLAFLLAGVLATRGRALVTRRTAAVDLWGVPDLPRPRQVELLTTMTQGLSLPNARFSRTNHLPLADQAIRLGVPTVTYARLVIEMAPFLPPRPLGEVVDFGLRRRFLTIPQLVACFERWDGPGRRGASAVARVLGDRTTGYRIPDSTWEDRMYERLLRGGLRPGARWHRVEAPGMPTYVIDLAYPDLLVGVEFHSYEWHAQRTPFDDDADRSAALAALGWLLIPVTSSSSIPVTIRRIHDALDRRAGHLR